MPLRSPRRRTHLDRGPARPDTAPHFLKLAFVTFLLGAHLTMAQGSQVPLKAVGSTQGWRVAVSDEWDVCISQLQFLFIELPVLTLSAGPGAVPNSCQGTAFSEPFFPSEL